MVVRISEEDCGNEKWIRSCYFLELLEKKIEIMQDLLGLGDPSVCRVVAVDPVELNYLRASRGSG